jgi:hypothetical protein
MGEKGTQGPPKKDGTTKKKDGDGTREEMVFYY